MVKPKPTPPVAIIGMAARLPGADDVDRYWHNLMTGVESIERVPHGGCDGRVDPGGFVPAVGKVAGIELFDADHFRIPPAEAAVMDPQHRVLLEVASAALDDAGYRGPTDEVVGVFAGCGENIYFRDFVAPTERGSKVGSDPRVLSGNAADFLAARIAFKLGLSGPSVNVQTACATSLSAVAMACAALTLGDCDIAVAGGVSLLMPDVEGYTYQTGAIFSADGHCRTFDAEASGTVPSSGAAMVVLRRDDEALANRDRRHAVIRGWAVNNDGGSGAGFMAPSPKGQEAVVRAALARAGVSPDAVGYVEAHGTGTPIGDPIELEALRRVFATPGRAARSCVLGAVKTNIGHTDAAAGVAGLIKAALAVERGTIPGTLHFRTPSRDLDRASSPFHVSADPVEWRGEGPRMAGVSAFGLGGNNAHVVLAQATGAEAGEVVRPRQVVTISARTESELLEARARLAQWVLTQESLDGAALADVSYTLAVGRPQLEYRWATCVSDPAELADRLAAPSGSEAPTRRWSLSLAGSPDDLVEMGRRHLADEPLFRAALRGLAPSLDLDTVPVLHLAALSGLAAVAVLEELGLTFGRVDAPRWAWPALAWWSTGRDPAHLDDALRACAPDPDLTVPCDGAARLVVGKDVELSAAVAQAWARGARIDWSHYYSVESRGRVPLPTYPFARRRFWLSRPEPTRPAATQPRTDEAASASPRRADVLSQVKLVWSSVLGLDDVEHDAHFVDDLGGDSVYAVEIGAELGETFHVELPVDLPFVAPTVAESARYVERLLDGAEPHAAPGAP